MFIKNENIKEPSFKSKDLQNIEDLKIFSCSEKRDIYISIIVPCYNVGRYLDQCLNSLVNQTMGLEHLQIILIDDASTDRTFKKMQEWKEKYPEEIIIVSYKNNMRQGGARNVGIALAEGEYIGFVDSDDWVELDMFETLYSRTKDFKYDMVRGKHIYDKVRRPIDTSKYTVTDICYNFEQKGGFYITDTPNVGVNGNLGGIWSAIYKRSIIVENDVYFPENITYEDNYWASILSLYIKNLCIVDKIVYNYFYNLHSTVTSKNSLHHLDRLNAEILKVEEYKKRGAFLVLHDELEWQFIQYFYLNTLYTVFVKFDFIPDIFGFMKEKICYYFPNFKENPRVLKCDEFSKKMLSLLEIPGSLTVGELEKIKEVYLQVVVALQNSKSNDD